MSLIGRAMSNAPGHPWVWKEKRTGVRIYTDPWTLAQLSVQGLRSKRKNE